MIFFIGFSFNLFGKISDIYFACNKFHHLIISSVRSTSCIFVLVIIRVVDRFSILGGGCFNLFRDSLTKFIFKNFEFLYTLIDLSCFNFKYFYFFVKLLRKLSFLFKVRVNGCINSFYRVFVGLLCNILIKFSNNNLHRINLSLVVHYLLLELYDFWYDFIIKFSEIFIL